MPATEIKLTLFDNSHTFTKEALSKAVLAETDSTQWQFAVFCLVQAIELLLKERLRAEHATLIYADVDKRRNTVTLDQAVSRLKEIAHVQFSPDDLETLKVASHWRNLVVHFEFQFSVQELKSVFGKLFGFLSQFHQTHLGQSIQTYLPDDLWDEAISINEYGKELFGRAQLRIQQENIDSNLVWTCNHCGWESFVIQDDLCLCLVCGHQEGVDQCADCENIFYDSEMEDIYVGNAKGLDASIRLCVFCFEKRQEQDERDFWEP
jgi:hypothetical protein